MLYDMRTYTCRPGTINKQFNLYAQFGYEVQKRHLNNPVVFLKTETGDVNSYTHIWQFESAHDREVKRNSLQKDPEWIDYLAKSAQAGYILAQENKLMLPAPFFKI